MISLKSVRAKFVGLIVGSVAATFVAGAAQSQSIVQPPVISAIDANGVNLADGSFKMPGLDVGIGSGGSGLARVTQGKADNFSGDLYYAGYPVQFNGNTATEALIYLTASYGGTTYRFLVGHWYSSTGMTWYTGALYPVGGGSTFIVCNPDGSQVQNHTGTCTLNLEDGTQVTYDRTMTSGSNYGPVTTLTKPDGEVINVSYYGVTTGGVTDVKAINIVSSSLGWALKYTVDGSYNVTGVAAVNTSVTPCTPSACSPTADSPTQTITNNGSTVAYATNGTTMLTASSSAAPVTLTTPLGITKSVSTYTTGSFSGRVSAVSDAGQTWNYTYSQNSSTGATTTTVTAPNGTTQSLVVSFDNKILSQADAANRATSFLYDSSNRLIEIVNPDGNSQTGGFTYYQYDSAGRVIETDVVPKGGATNGAINGGAAIVTKATYNVACDTTNFTNTKWCRKPSTTTDANGVVTTYAYDDNLHTNTGQILSVTMPAVNGVSAQTRYTYTAQTPHSYNQSGNYIAQPVVYRLTQTSSCMSSNWNGSACASGAADERRATTAYNNTNILPYSTTASLGDGTVTQTTTIAQYTNNGDVLVSQGMKQTAADETYYFYDGLRRQIGTVGVDPDGTGGRHRRASITSYDADGHVAEIVNGVVGNATTGIYSGGDAPTRNSQAYSDWQAFYNDWVAKTQNSAYVQERNTNEFDGYGRAVIARHYIGNAATAKDVTQRSYDNMQRIQCEAIRLNSADYGNLGSMSACSLGTTGSDGSHDRITAYSYDALGNVTNTTSAYGTGSARSDFTKLYDTSSAGTATLTYAEDGNGNRTSYYYDSFNRLVKTCYPLSGTTHASSSTDCAQAIYRTTSLTGVSQIGTLPNYVSLRDGNNNYFTYDAPGRVSQITGAEGQSFTYDNFNNVLAHATSTSGTTGTEVYTYNALGWLQSDAQPAGTASYTYDGYGRRYQLTYPGGFNITYGYDAGDEVVSLNENGNVSLIGFDYDDYGHRAHIYRATGVTTAYGYDSNLRLGTLTQGASGATFYNQVTYGYNAADQINSKAGTNGSYNYTPGAKSISYNINGLNQIASVNGTSFNYDGRGNLSGDGSGSTYGYNVDNMLTSATQSGVTSTLTYDSAGRLYQIAKNGSITRFLYDGTDLIAEYDGSGNLLRRYVHGPGDDEPLVWYEGSGTGSKYYYGADDNGTVNLVTDSSGGQYAVNTYDEYGLPGSGNTGRFQYTGQTWLSEIGMYYYKARLYNPAIGRFMQTDPIGYGDGMNDYAYVHNAPVNNSDPTGLCNSPGGCPDDITTVVVHGIDNAFKAWDKFQNQGGACGILGGSNCGPGISVCTGMYCIPVSAPAPAAPTPAPAKKSGSPVPPAKACRTGGTPYKPSHRARDYHEPSYGAPIDAPDDGQVTAGRSDGYHVDVPGGHPDYSVQAPSGSTNYTDYRTNDGYSIRYAHTHPVRLGVFTKGQQIATVDNTGRNTGPHTHVQVNNPAGQRIDPDKYFTQCDAKK